MGVQAQGLGGKGAGAEAPAVSGCVGMHVQDAGQAERIDVSPIIRGELSGETVGTHLAVDLHAVQDIIKRRGLSDT